MFMVKYCGLSYRSTLKGAGMSSDGCGKVAQAWRAGDAVASRHGAARCAARFVRSLSRVPPRLLPHHLSHRAALNHVFIDIGGQNGRAAA
jgi:hypothetical protein